MTKVSIVMIVYNHERFLRSALESILMQQVNFDYEIILGEDCSTDDTRSIVEEYEEKFQGRLQAIYRCKNIGATQNFIDCLLKAGGKYIAFLEGDDYWIDKYKLQKMVDYLEKNPKYSAAAHNYQIVDVSNNYIRNGLECESIVEFNKEEFEKFNLPSQTSTILMRNIIPQIKKEDWDKIIKYKWMPGDRIYFLILLQYGDIAILPQIMSAYRYYIEAGGTNWTSQYDIAAKQDYYYFFKTMCGMEQLSAELGNPLNMLDAKVELFRKAVRYRRWSKHKINLYLQCADMFFLEKHKIKFLKAVIKSFKTSR